MLTDRQQLGLKGEAIAAEWLEQRGWRILDRRFRSGHRDLDIVASYYDRASHERIIAFVEVRTRHSATFGHPIETVHPKKQRELRLAAQAWMMCNRRSISSYRFDLIGIVFRGAKPEIEYIPNAF
jgi:putative endonuclease